MAEKFTFRCPKCDTHASFTLVLNYETFYRDENNREYRYTLLKCDVCERVVFFIPRQPDEQIEDYGDGDEPARLHLPFPSSPAGGTGAGHSDQSISAAFFSGWELVDYYPKRSYTLHKAITPEIGKYLIEAYRCHDNHSANGSVAMSRRAIQKTCKKLGAKKAKLNDQIDEVMPEQVREYAHAIRLWGNLGAHPDDFIEDVEEKDAKEMIEFVEHVFNYVFIMPQRLKESLEKTKNRKK